MGDLIRILGFPSNIRRVSFAVPWQHHPQAAEHCQDDASPDSMNLDRLSAAVFPMSVTSGSATAKTADVDSVIRFASMPTPYAEMLVSGAIR